MRKWQVQFQISNRMDAFPYPAEIVEEVQTSPQY